MAYNLVHNTVIGRTGRASHPDRVRHVGAPGIGSSHATRLLEERESTQPARLLPTNGARSFVSIMESKMPFDVCASSNIPISWPLRPPCSTRLRANTNERLLGNHKGMCIGMPPLPRRSGASPAPHAAYFQ